MWKVVTAGALVIALHAQVAAPPPQAPAPIALAMLDTAIREGQYGNVDALLVRRGNEVVLTRRYPRDYRAISAGQKSAIGCGEGCTDKTWMHEFNYLHPTWHPYYLGSAAHTLQSVTKSIAATLVGIAIGRGEIKSLDQPILDFFTDKDLTKVDPRLQQATIADLLTMRTGIEWHEQDRPLDDTNTTVQLEKSRDWLQFTLNQPMDALPGTKWAYNSGGSALMAGIIRSATRRHIDVYATDVLFRPIGIKNFYWKKTPTGHPDTEGGLYLTADDLATIGALYLHDGMFEGRRVLPEGWVKSATTRHVKGVAAIWDYGYQWWITTVNGLDVWAGRGFGGQLLIVIPARDTVAVVNAWNIFGGRTANIFTPLTQALTQ